MILGDSEWLVSQVLKRLGYLDEAHLRGTRFEDDDKIDL